MPGLYPGAADEMPFLVFVRGKALVDMARFHQAYGYAHGLMKAGELGGQFNAWGFATAYVAYKRQGLVEKLWQAVKMYRTLHPNTIRGMDVEGMPFEDEPYTWSEEL